MVQRIGGIVPLHLEKDLLPFDGKSIHGAMREAGIALVIHADPHLELSAPTARIFEAAQAGCVIISDKNPFIIKHFGDTVLYFDETKEGQELFQQIHAHVQWIFDHQKEAEAMARRAHAIFGEKFNLEGQVKDLALLHERIITC